MTQDTSPHVLIANRGEIAARIVRATESLGWTAVVVHATDETPPFTDTSDRATTVVALPGSGVQAYLDIDALVAAARRSGATMIHPGYGFLSESPAFARACREAGLIFVGPDPDTLDLLGDKVQARRLAESLDVPVLAAAADVAEARRMMLVDHPPRPLMLKAVGGGGGRGMRPVHAPEGLDDAWARASTEAERSFSDARVYAEELLPHARHIEVQVLGDGEDVVAIGDRDCSLQRRRQKVVEFAPAVTVSPSLRRELAEAAVRLTRRAHLSGAATVEFLVDGGRWVFMEVNPRIQVEHTVTEEVTGVDLVAAQLLIASGCSLRDIGLSETPTPRGIAVESRVTAETFGPDGVPEATSGRLREVQWPTGAGIRIESWVAPGTDVTGAFDPLLAKVVTRSARPDLPSAVRAHRAAVDACVLDGVPTTLPFLTALLDHPDVIEGAATTTFVDDHLTELLALAGASTDGTANDERHDGASETTDVVARSVGTVLEVRVRPGQAVRRGQEVVLVEAMKMEHALTAPCDGVVTAVHATVGHAVRNGLVLVDIEAADEQTPSSAAAEQVDPDHERADLAFVREAHRRTLDEARPEAVAKRHGTGRRTARENIADLVDAGSFREYGALAIAAQRARRSVEELTRISPADGIVTGLARINGDLADDPVCAVLAYDYTVMAGTQGALNHKKTDRLLELARERRLPVVLFAEGGGGRPGDTDTTAVAGLDLSTFSTMGSLRGTVPTIGIAAGRCFAGNAALLGACDIVVATQDANLGMGGPAMIEGGGLGTFTPEQVGPAAEQYANGVVDVLVEDEAAAVRVSKDLLALLQQPRLRPGAAGEPTDQRMLRHLVPENRRRAYAVRGVVDGLVDDGSFRELRGGFGTAAVTGLARIGGRTVGIMANDPEHGGGAIDADAGRKLGDFLDLCGRHSVPIVSLCDTPGFMVGPESERLGTVRIFPELFVAGARLNVPLVTVITRKGYGLGAMAMAGGSFATPVSTVAWPTGEIGAMGLEGAVRLGYRRELEACADPQERRELFDTMVAEAYAAGRAVNAARAVEIDAVIDPAETRDWIITAFEGA